jgi:uncharacterized protein YbjT (DUF2867 family)
MQGIADKLILVIGGTGAQGQAVVKALLEPNPDRAPYAVRILGPPARFGANTAPSDYKECVGDGQ